VSEGILTPSAGNLGFHGSIAQSASVVGNGDNLPGLAAPGGEPSFQVFREENETTGCGLRFLASDLDVAAVPLDVLPIEAVDLSRPNACERPDGHEGEDPGVGS
jgi:hypothetical protein